MVSKYRDLLDPVNLSTVCQREAAVTDQSLQLSVSSAVWRLGSSPSSKTIASVNSPEGDICSYAQGSRGSDHLLRPNTEPTPHHFSPTTRFRIGCLTSSLRSPDLRLTSRAPLLGLYFVSHAN
nr:hypothetical protein HmN_000991800 [Hymenolepis microstoma]